MQIEIDPDDVELQCIDLDFSHLIYRGVSFALDGNDYIKHQAKRSSEFIGWSQDDGVYDALLHAAGADLIAVKVAAMSAHERLEFFRKAQACA
ncbi:MULTISPECIES: hypothetical protein [unclassified Sulfitobacter]|jgi:hypothetical protein|uniref:hypothetical protein n=1 Tax=unclassified Sulfitobacter TaxID=196795 RepID=UPI0004E2B4A9|nr:MULTISPECIES: hypothetical protein [unclassified Sulfitobacter]PTA98897.1 hypothetical protein C8254_10530 [Sulfitobacter sp. CB-A]ULO18984.1 hypothetical protein IV89_001975 [Sulfitobacter sp. CB2047]